MMLLGFPTVLLLMTAARTGAGYRTGQKGPCSSSSFMLFGGGGGGGGRNSSSASSSSSSFPIVTQSDDHRLRDCLNELKRAAGDSNSHWFGADWTTRCQSNRRRDTIDCYNPPKLSKYKSIGSRLLRVPTFHPKFLRNLEIFPRVTFHSPPGEYVGCDHRYVRNTSETFHVWPSRTPPLKPWDLRMEPRITWDQLEPDAAEEYRNQQNNNYIVIIMDVGFGELLYFAYNFPRSPTIIRRYKGPLNYRPSSPNPYAIIVLRNPNGGQRVFGQLEWEDSIEEDSTFNLQNFILKNDLTEDLVGLSWWNVASDPYAMEKQRKETVDNCPSLVRRAFWDGVSAFLPYSGVQSVDLWLSVTFNTPPIQYQICCESFHHGPDHHTLDPINVGAKGQHTTALHSISVRAPPQINVRLDEPRLFFKYNRTRSGRDHLSLLNGKLWTLLAFSIDQRESTPPSSRSSLNPRKSDPSSPTFNRQQNRRQSDIQDAVKRAMQKNTLAHWLISNLPTQTLANFDPSLAGVGAGSDGGQKGTSKSTWDTILPYLPPSSLPNFNTNPSAGGFRMYFLLLAQNEGRIERTKFDYQHFATSVCPKTLSKRCGFDIPTLMARYNLDLRGVSWTFVRADNYSRYQTHQFFGSQCTETTTCTRIVRHHFPPQMTASSDKLANAAASISILLPGHEQITSTFWIVVVFTFTMEFRSRHFGNPT